MTSDAGLHTDEPGMRPDTSAPIGPLADSSLGVHAVRLQISGVGGLPGIGGMGGLGGVGGSGATGAIAGVARGSVELEQAPYAFAQESTAMPSNLRSSKYSGLTE